MNRRNLLKTFCWAVAGLVAAPFVAVAGNRAFGYSGGHVLMEIAYDRFIIDRAKGTVWFRSRIDGGRWEHNIPVQMTDIRRRLYGRGPVEPPIERDNPGIDFADEQAAITKESLRA